MTTSIVKDKADEFLKELVGTVKEEIYGLIERIIKEDLVSVTNKLPIEDCCFEYDDILNVIDCYFILESGLSLLIGRFVDETAEDPIVFSIWRGKALLVSDEKPFKELVDIINSVYFKSEEQ